MAQYRSQYRRRSQRGRRAADTGRRGGNRNDNKNMLYYCLGGLGLLVIAAVVILVVALGGGKINENTKFHEGVHIGSVDVSGMTMDEAEPYVAQVSLEALSGISFTYTVNEQTYTLNANDVGAYVDHFALMEQAMLFGRSGQGKVDRENRKLAEEQGYTFNVCPSITRETLLATLTRYGADYNTEPKDATIEVETSQDQEKLTVSGKIVYVEEVNGLMLDAEALADTIVAKLAEGVLTGQLEVSIEETPADLTLDELKENFQLIDTYDTSFKDSVSGRRFNIWKMSTVVNGTVLQPGEEWSINEHAGDRTKENGWADAAGIKGGAYVDEPGGGICQVSTTLYLALIKSEVEIVDRSHHSWPLTYAPVGLDATISTGAPDFVYKNNKDYPIAVLVNCDAADERVIEVQVYGPPLDYEVRYESKVITDEEPPSSPAMKFDPSMSPGATAWTKLRKNYIVAEIYKIKVNKETGEEIERVLERKETYGYRIGEISYGPSPTPGPSASVPQPSQPANTPTAE